MKNHRVVQGAHATHVSEIIMSSMYLLAVVFVYNKKYDLSLRDKTYGKRFLRQFPRIF